MSLRVSNMGRPLRLRQETHDTSAACGRRPVWSGRGALPYWRSGYLLPSLYPSHALEAQGWRVLVIWDCETKDEAGLAMRLKRFLMP